MSSSPSPKERHQKDATYMRRAYLYSAILLVLGVIGAFMLGERIAEAEKQRHQQLAEPQTEQQQGEEPEPPPVYHRPPPED